MIDSVPSLEKCFMVVLPRLFFLEGKV